MSTTSRATLQPGLTKARRYDGEYGAAWNSLFSPLGTWARPSQFFPGIEMENPDKEPPIHEAHAACFDSRMEDRKSGAPHRCGRVFSGRSRQIACPGCGRQRHSSGARECARAERLGQRSQRHRQRGQSACDTAAGHNAGYAARRIPFGQLPRAAGAARGKDQTDAICGIQITSRAGPSDGRQAARQAARRQHPKHLQGMLSSARLGFRLAGRDSDIA
jgi:hypothetical protein